MKKRKHIADQFQDAYRDIEAIDKEIKKRHRYFCGIVSEKRKNEIGCGDLFFESPNGQNEELRCELRNIGWRNAGYVAEYQWKLYKGDITIAYVEGDVYIRAKKKVRKRKAS